MSGRTDELLAELVADIMAERDNWRAEAERLRDELREEMIAEQDPTDRRVMEEADAAIYRRAVCADREATRHSCKTFADWCERVILCSQLPGWMSRDQFTARYIDNLRWSWAQALEADPLEVDDEA